MVELTIRQENKENIQPFIIRAHHIPSFIDVLNGYSPDEIVKLTISLLERKKIKAEWDEWDDRTLWYINDVLGETQEDLNGFRKSSTQVFKDFLTLTSEHPVKIVEGRKDKLCEGCAIGEHCTEYFPGQKKDIQAINKFIDIAKRLKIEDRLQLLDETTTYSNSEPRKTRSILTTAGVTKEILLNFNS